ncbi:MAG: hypothetical protein QOH47_2384 [Sphingomonadales bacterium]|jgi:hypothetical protein|nr:hypothetical protein [Sphingomonadales bacterium]
MTAPDLSALTHAQASALEQIAGAAILQMLTRQSNAREAIANGGSDRWVIQNHFDLADAQRLEAAARQFERAAHDRALKAGRDECIAARVIHAFAIEAMRAPMAVAA